ncbi:VOC family protein [Gimesia sp.]|uniref:VOC family protein n=1 Tax=Gimesia sp. TaxID=2024833 RepID=UPI003A90825E
MSQENNTIQELVPLLFVEDIDVSVVFYTDKLGFEISMKWEPEEKLMWCRLERGSASLMLQSACPDEDGVREERIKGVGFFFLCSDAQIMFEEFSAKGLNLEPPQIAFYGMNQLFLKDPDGYELCFQNQV